MALNGGFVKRRNNDMIVEKRARPDCTFLQTDLARHSPQDKFVVANGRITIKLSFTSDILTTDYTD